MKLSVPGIFVCWEFFDYCFRLGQLFLVCSGFLLLLDSVLEDYTFLEFFPFHPDFQISWHIVARSNFLQSLYFRGIGCNFSSFISHFIYLGPLSFFLDNSG